MKDGRRPATYRQPEEVAETAPAGRRAFGTKRSSIRPAFHRSALSPRQGIDMWRLKGRIGTNVAAASGLFIWAIIGSTLLAGVLAYLAIQLVRL